MVARSRRARPPGAHRVPRPSTVPARRPAAVAVEATIVAEALASQTAGYRLVTAFVRRKLGVPVNRKRVLRVMRERKLIQRRRPLARRKRPGVLRVERPRQLWLLDMTSIWVAEHGSKQLELDHRLVHPRDRRLEPGDALPWRRGDSRRGTSGCGPRDPAGRARAGSDNGSAFTARLFRSSRCEHGIKHRRGGYRVPESQAFIESWFGKLKEREVWLNEYETLDDARRGIGGYVDGGRRGVPARPRRAQPGRQPVAQPGLVRHSRRTGVRASRGRRPGARRRDHERLWASIASMIASEEPIVAVPIGVPPVGAWKSLPIMLTTRWCTTSVWGYSSSSIRFLASVSWASRSACGSPPCRHRACGSVLSLRMG